MVAALISGLAIGANTVMTKQLTYETTQATLVLWVTSFCANLPLVFVLQEPLPTLAWQIEWLYVVLFALASVLSSWLLLAGMKYIDAGWAGILGLLEIVFGVMFGYLFFAERIGLVPTLGIILIMAASAMPHLFSRSNT